MVNTSFAMKEGFGKWVMKQNRDKLDMSVSTRLPLARFRTLETWCNRSLRKRSELVGIILNRVLEIYELEAGADEPLEFFVHRLHLDRDS